MVTNITGFQLARRRAAEKAKLEELKKDVNIELTKSNVDTDNIGDATGDADATDAADPQEDGTEVMTEEEVKAKLVELGVSFHPNAKLKTLQEKLKAAEVNG